MDLWGGRIEAECGGLLILYTGVSGIAGSNPALPASVNLSPMSNVMGARFEDLAWAAGIFDGEGSTSTYVPKGSKTPRRQMAVSQGGLPGQKPPILLRFKEIVGVGNVTGPYRHGLYYWKITKKDDVDLVGAMLWHAMSAEKRRQFAAAAIRMKRSVPGAVDDTSGREFESAWAAGLFDGEGTFGAYASARMKESWRGVSMSIPQGLQRRPYQSTPSLSRCCGIERSPDRASCPVHGRVCLNTVGRQPEDTFAAQPPR